MRNYLLVNVKVITGVNVEIAIGVVPYFLMLGQLYVCFKLFVSMIG